MSQYPQYPQYPPPYPPNQPGYGAYPQASPDQLLAPARRAGVLMIVLGVLSVACGLCTAYQARNFDINAASATPELQQQMQKQIEMFETQTGMSFQTLMLIVGAIPLAVGAVVGGLGFFVRNGSLGWIIASVVLVAAMLLVTGFALLGGAIQGGATGGPVVAVASVCMYGIPFLLLILLMVWLVQAARASSQIAAARQQYQAQVWQYQQHQQNYLQQPGQPSQQQGYGAPPTPPPAGMGYHYPPAQPPAVQPPVGQAPSVQPPAQQGAQPPTSPYSPPPAPPEGYYVVPPPPVERKDPSDGAPPAG